MTDEQVEQSTSLAVNLTDHSVADLNSQRTMLRTFIQSQLRQEVDFGIIPGVKSPSLFKPGAEKLCKLFQLGSRIISSDKQIDIQNNFAMFTYQIEVFHIPSGKALAQCEGSVNSQEKKYAEKTIYENGKPKKVPQRVADILNTMQKMAQKRGYVGAVIMATGASDFFTQDVEDMDPRTFQKPPGATQAQGGGVTPNQGAKVAASGAYCEACGVELILSKAGTGWYCPNFKDASKGDHTRMKFTDLEAYKANRAKEVSGEPIPTEVDPNWDDHKL